MGERRLRRGWNGRPARCGADRRTGRLGEAGCPPNRLVPVPPFTSGTYSEKTSDFLTVMPVQRQTKALVVALFHQSRDHGGALSLERYLKTLFAVAFLIFAAVPAVADNCAICGQPINGRVYLWTDGVTHQQVEVCPTCNLLPPCFICGLPVKDGVHLPDGRWLCARDAQSAILDIGGVQRVFGQVHDYMDHLYERFTSFPTNVDVTVIDGIDANQFDGTSFESPDLRGLTEPITTNGVKHYKISLLTGLPLAQLEEVCAHELSHAWVGENVSPGRHARIDRDAEEGFCEMMGYLIMDAMGEEGEKKRVLENAYTRGQVELFIAAEQQYGFDEILDWMQHGVGGRLEEGHLDEVRDVQMPVTRSVVKFESRRALSSRPPPVPSTLELQGIMWGSMPSAIINGHSFFAGDEAKVPVGQVKVSIQCLGITKTAVDIRNLDSGKEEKLDLSSTQ